MKNSKYWQQRFTQLENAQNKLAGTAGTDIEKYYRQAENEIESKISMWYQRFAENNEITMAEARQWMRGKDLKEFKWDVNEYIEKAKENGVNGQWIKELENASAKFHVSKLEALKIHTQNSLEILGAKQTASMTKTMANVYESGYYHTAYELQHGFNLGWDIAGVNQSQIEKVISRPWAADGYNFSERIWNNKEKLISTVHNELTQNILLGQDPQKAIDAIAKQMGTSKNNAGRLVMTEEAYFSSAAQKDCFNELGIDEYQIVATLDNRTSEICQTMDGQHFPMKDYEAGVTAPPFHVWCRSTTCPYFDDMGAGERFARNPDGTSYYVPDNMSYKEWKEKFVDGGDLGNLQQAIYEDGSVHFVNPEPAEPPKKEYLTEKKLKSNISEADAQIKALEQDVQTESVKQQIAEIQNQKAGWEQKLQEKQNAKQIKTLTKQEKDLTGQKQEIQIKLDGMEVKTYSGIWKDDVTTADYNPGMNIQGKKDYYEGKFKTETDPALLEKYHTLYDKLQEFETEGKAYYDVKSEFDKVSRELNQVQKDLTKLKNGDIINESGGLFPADAYSQARKDAAYWFTSSNGGAEAADAVLRDECGRVWRNASPLEKESIHLYTSSYSRFNEPLRGIEYGTEKYFGPGKLDLKQIGVRQGWKPGFQLERIKAMTSVIQESSYDFDIWLQRGCEKKNMDKFLNVNASLFGRPVAEIRDELLGKEVIDYGFMSCSVAKEHGLNLHSGFLLNIYAPKGTKMMYAEPFSSFGRGFGESWDGIKKQNSIGGEAEMIIQRKTRLKITKVEKRGNIIYLDMEVIGQLEDLNDI